jgi:V8-like Glu-specific endopeptidase
MQKPMWMMCTGIALVTACAVEDVNDEGGNDHSVASESSEQGAMERVTGSVDLDVVPYVVPANPTVSPGNERSPASMSRAELAEAMRPVILKGDGKLYIGSEPNWRGADVAIAARGTLDVGDGGDGNDGDAGGDGIVSDEPSGMMGEARAIARVIGPDGRHVVTNTTVAPYRNIARVLIGFDDGGWAGCTGSYIGPWTFVFAGHCVRSSTGSVARRVVFEPARNGSSLPYGSFDCRNDDASSSNNFLLSIPAAYASSGDWNWDYAVVDTFPCHRAPHWFGEPATNQGVLVDSGTATYAHYGYPGPACPGAPAGGEYMCGMSGSAYVNGSWLETEHIDSDHGQSGGPWFIGSRVAGTLIGYREYFDLFRCGFDVCRRTVARRIDSTYMSFISSIAYDY